MSPPRPLYVQPPHLAHVPYRGAGPALVDLGDRAKRPTASREVPIICGIRLSLLPGIPRREALGKPPGSVSRDGAGVPENAPTARRRGLAGAS
jgi:hypothetical protein